MGDRGSGTHAPATDIRCIEARVRHRSWVRPARRQGAARLPIAMAVLGDAAKPGMGPTKQTGSTGRTGRPSPLRAFLHCRPGPRDASMAPGRSCLYVRIQWRIYCWTCHAWNASEVAHRVDDGPPEVAQMGLRECPRSLHRGNMVPEQTSGSKAVSAEQLTVGEVGQAETRS